MAEEFNLDEFSQFNEDAPEQVEQPQQIEVTEHNDNPQLVEYETPEKPQEVKQEKQEVKDNPDSYKYWQSQADKRDRELREEREKREKLEREFETIKSQINPPKKSEPLLPPQPPRSDDPLERIQYAEEMAKYQQQLIEQKFGTLDTYFQSIEAERQTRAKQEQEAQQKAWYIGQMTKTGLSPEEASQALAEFSKAADTPDQYFKDLADFWRFKNQKLDPRAQNMEKRASRQGEIAPLGTIPSESEPQNVNPSDAFFSDLKQYEKRYF